MASIVPATHSVDAESLKIILLLIIFLKHYVYLFFDTLFAYLTEKFDFFNYQE